MSGREAVVAEARSAVGARLQGPSAAGWTNLTLQRRRRAKASRSSSPAGEEGENCFIFRQARGDSAGIAPIGKRSPTQGLNHRICGRPPACVDFADRRELRVPEGLRLIEARYCGSTKADQTSSCTRKDAAFHAGARPGCPPGRRRGTPLNALPARAARLRSASTEG